MRYMELAATISTIAEKAFQFLRTSGLMHKSVQLYDTDDILLKLNVAEVIDMLG